MNAEDKSMFGMDARKSGKAGGEDHEFGQHFWGGFFFFSKEVREMIGGSGDLNGMHYNGILLMWIIQRRENYQCRGEGNNWRNILEQVKREEIRYINGGSVLVKWWRKQRKIIFYFVIIFKWNIDQVINWAENREETAENLELWNNYLSVGRRVNGLGQC